LGINISETGENLMFSDKRFGLSSSLIAASRGILGEEKEDKDKIDPKMMKGGKTKVELEPKTDDDTRDYDDKKKSMKEGKEHTVPKTDKEKKLAALASPKDKITHKDVMVGRGVIAKEEVDLESLTEEDLEEALKKSQPAGEWIKDFVKSDNPKFAGKSKKKRMQMALGAYYAKQRNEEVELSDEELARLDAIAQSLDEAKPTIVSAPIRGANQDQSGENTKSTSTDYTISDSKKMKKEELELDEDKIYFKHTSGVKGEIEKLGRNYVTKIKGAIPGYGHISQKHHNTRIDAENHMKKIGFHKEELELDEAKRGRPKKNPTPDDEQEEHEHVIMQLRKVVSTHGALSVKHLDGKSTKITPQLAQHALNKHSAMKTAAEKQDFESKMHKSHDSMKSALGQ
jgi:phage FluMu protein gp41